MLAWKYPWLEVQYVSETDPLLQSLMEWIESYTWDQWRRVLTVTSVKRFGDPASTHCTTPVRALDFRSRDFAEHEIGELLFTTNREWIYDPARPDKHCLVCHDSGQGRHFHAQVFPGYTKRVSEDT